MKNILKHAFYLAILTLISGYSNAEIPEPKDKIEEYFFDEITITSGPRSEFVQKLKQHTDYKVNIVAKLPLGNPVGAYVQKSFDIVLKEQNIISDNEDFQIMMCDDSDVNESGVINFEKELSFPQFIQHISGAEKDKSCSESIDLGFEVHKDNLRFVSNCGSGAILLGYFTPAKHRYSSLGVEFSQGADIPKDFIQRKCGTLLQIFDENSEVKNTSLFARTLNSDNLVYELVLTFQGGVDEKDVNFLAKKQFEGMLKAFSPLIGTYFNSPTSKMQKLLNLQIAVLDREIVEKGHILAKMKMVRLMGKKNDPKNYTIDIEFKSDQ